MKINKLLETVIKDKNFPKNKDMQIAYLDGLKKGLEISRQVDKEINAK